MSLPVRSLSIHAHYSCRHSGACCTAGWPIPVEPDTTRGLLEAVAEGRLRVGTARDESVEKPAGLRPLVMPEGAQADTPVVTARDERGVCVFYDRGRKRCDIHRQLGEGLLPDTCRQFPRVSLLDGRGVSVTLSHFCPTAAALLFEENDLMVVAQPLSFPSTFPFDPLDARGELPPLLHPKLLLDLETFDAWERAAIGLLAAPARSPEQALTAVGVLTETLRRWQPGEKKAGQALAEALAEATALPQDGERMEWDCVRASEHHDLVRGAVPETLRPERRDAAHLARADACFLAPEWPAYAGPLKRYLAAKIFASWLAYQGRGLRTIVFSAEVALSLVRVHAALECERQGRPLDRNILVAAFGRSDELFLHLASRQPLADALAIVEGSLAAPGRLGVR